jgi:hypothetical protein
VLRLPFLRQNVKKKMVSKFWQFCVPVRVLLAIAVCFLPTRFLPYAGALALFGVAGLLYRFFTYTDSQLGAFNQRVTWNSVRPLHAMIWALFAVLAVSKNTRAKWIPFVDVAVGVAFYLKIFT